MGWPEAAVAVAFLVMAGAVCIVYLVTTGDEDEGD